MIRLTIHIIAITLLTLYSAGVICAQGATEEAQNVIERYEGTPQTMERDSILIHNYNYLAERYSGSNDSLAKHYLKHIDGLRSSTKWPKATGLYYRALGKFHDRRGDFQEALDAYTHAVEALHEAGDKSDYIAYAGILKAFVLNNNGLPDQCERELNLIRPIAEQLENKNYLAWIIDAFGDHHFYSGFGRQDFAKALEYYKQVEVLLPQVKSNMIIADNAHCLSGCYLRLGMEDEALKYRDKALEVAEKHGIQGVIFAVYSDLADIYEEQGNFEESIRYRQLSLDHARKEHWIEMESRAQSNLANTYKLAGDFENALGHFERLQAIEDSLSRFSVQERYAELQTKYESGKKDLEIERLKGDNLMILRNVLIAILLAGLVFMIYYQRVNKKLKIQNEELKRKHDEIQAALAEGRNLERKRMAVELHDNINAKIAATKWMLETLNSDDRPEHDRKLITTLIGSVTDIYEDVRFLSHNLVPKEIEQKTLKELVEQLISNLNQNEKIAFTFQSFGKSPGLSDVLKLQMYSTIMELLNNIIKHADCRTAAIALACHNDHLNLTIADDGVGFDPDQEFQGAGLKNARARVEGMSGNMRIQSKVPSGTDIEITIPLDSGSES